MTQTVEDNSAMRARARAEKSAAMQRREAKLRRLPLLPALLFTIVMTQVPFLLALWYGLTEWKLTPPTPRTFIGFDHYVDIFTNNVAQFDNAVVTSIIMTVSSVLLSVFFGLLLALLLDRKFLGRGLVRTLLITPFLFMPVVSGSIWKAQMLNSEIGVVNWIITSLGFEQIEIVSRYPLWSVVLVLVWQWTPFMMLILLAGLQGQNPSVLEAARVDGASPRAIFFQITLPQLRPYLELGTLLGSIYLIQVYDHIVVMTQGGKATNLPYFVYQRAIGISSNFGQASALSIVVVLASIIIATFGLRTLSGLLEGEEPA